MVLYLPPHIIEVNEFQAENQATTRKGFSGQAVLLTALLVAVGVGAAVHTLTSIFTGANGLVNTGQIFQITTTSNRITTPHTTPKEPRQRPDDSPKGIKSC